MSSMRIDGDKSAKVWLARARKLLGAAMNDGCSIEWNPVAETLEIKKGDDAWVLMHVEDEE